MKKFRVFLAILAVALVFGLALSGCKNEPDGPATTKFEGTWYSRDPSNPTGNYNRFIFTGTDYSYIAIGGGQPVPGQAMSGTFTFTDTVITFVTSNGTTIPRTYELSTSGLSLQEFGWFVKE